MERQGDEVHVETDEARGGSTPNTVRWILIVGLILAIGLLSATWIIGALGMEEEDQHQNVNREILDRAEDEGRDTDSIVSDDFNQIEGAEPAEASTPDANEGEPTAVEN